MLLDLFFTMVAWSCLASALALGLGAVVQTRDSWWLWHARRVAAKDAHTSQGVVELRGPARSDMPLTAPLTGRSCVQFTVVMERRQPHDGQRRDDKPDLITFVGASRFGVDDGTGVVKIDLRQHRIPVTGTSVIRQPLERLTSPLEKLLAARLGVPGGLWCVNRDVVATEAVLLDGTDVSVIVRRKGDTLEPLHVTTGRTRVIALQGLMRAGLALTGTAVLVGLFNWLR